MFEFKEFTNPESPDYDITSSLNGGGQEPTQNEPSNYVMPDIIPEDIEDDSFTIEEQSDIPDIIPEDVEDDNFTIEEQSDIPDVIEEDVEEVEMPRTRR